VFPETAVGWVLAFTTWISTESGLEFVRKSFLVDFVVVPTFIFQSLFQLKPHANIANVGIMKTITSFVLLWQWTAATDVLHLGHHHENKHNSRASRDSTTDYATSSGDARINNTREELPPLPSGCNVVSGRRCKMPDGSMHPSVMIGGLASTETAGTIRSGENLKRSAIAGPELLPDAADPKVLSLGDHSSKRSSSDTSPSGKSHVLTAESINLPTGLVSIIPKTVTVAFAADDHYLPKLMAVVEQLRSMKWGKSYRLIAYNLGMTFALMIEMIHPT